ncbi:hypothetical protein L1987_26763 [Smallanthus sonchifolius]|uniref:Uncharacterized protein n=1 Tax=Smallanthus sonchifolius TaxID=185202 RepID=A0ACB9IAU7_9ASTR|nr:hypothetical protein L1987_26763 [Smallanthus sonchifolius]
MSTLNLFTSIPVDPVIASDILKDPAKVNIVVIIDLLVVCYDFGEWRFIFDPGKVLAISYKSGEGNVTDPVSVDDILLQHGLDDQELWKNEVDEMKKVINTPETKHRPGVSFCTRTAYDENAITNALDIYTTPTYNRCSAFYSFEHVVPNTWEYDRHSRFLNAQNNTIPEHVLLSRT